MNWFEVIKENRLANEVITHTKVSGENKPESDDNRCREALKKKIGNLKWFHNMEEARTNLKHWEIFAESTNVSNMNGEGKQTYDEVIENMDTIPEEVCCLLLEVTNQTVQEAQSFLNTNWNNPEYNPIQRNQDGTARPEEQLDFVNWDSLNYNKNKVELGDEDWQVTSGLWLGSEGLGPYAVTLSLAIQRLRPNKFPDGFNELLIEYPSKWKSSFDIENTLDTRLDLLKDVVGALGMS